MRYNTDLRSRLGVNSSTTKGPRPYVIDAFRFVAEGSFVVESLVVEKCPPGRRDLNANRYEAFAKIKRAVTLHRLAVIPVKGRTA
jgi:hypothetical protein